jgi:DNA-binding beta-propeller fold protein YncE
MKMSLIILTAGLASASAAVWAAGGAPVSLEPGPSIEIPSSKGKFDFLRVDEKRHRLLGAHETDGTADYFDLKTNTLITRVKVGGAVDHAVDGESKYYYVSVQEDQRVAVLDAATLAEVRSIKVSGPTDAIIYEPKNHLVYVTHDDGADVWVIDPSNSKVIVTVAVPGVPEYMVYDESTDRIYLNIKSANKVAVIDPKTQKTVNEWATGPAAQPHGMALDTAKHRIFVAGANGKLAVIDTQSGKVTESTNIVEKVDQIAFDPDKQLVYCAGMNKISIVDTSGSNVATVGEQATAATARNVAVDPQTHAVWTTYTNGKSSFARAWLPK